VSDAHAATPSTGGRHYTLADMRARTQDPGVVVANVLPRAAFEDARIPNSISLPLADIPRTAATVLPDRDQEIALYCGGPT